MSPAVRSGAQAFQARPLAAAAFSDSEACTLLDSSCTLMGLRMDAAFAELAERVLFGKAGTSAPRTVSAGAPSLDGFGNIKDPA
jgi:hypothetical protein